MFPRLTNASDINKPVLNTPNHNTADRMSALYEEQTYELTRKKLVCRVAVIVFVLLIFLWVIYSLLFLLNLSIIPSDGLALKSVNVTDNQSLLDFTLDSNEYYLSDDYHLERADKANTILYFSVNKPILTSKITDKKSSISDTRTYKIYIDGVTAVYYLDDKDKSFLIWKR